MSLLLPNSLQLLEYLKLAVSQNRAAFLGLTAVDLAPNKLMVRVQGWFSLPQTDAKGTKYSEMASSGRTIQEGRTSPVWLLDIKWR